MDTSTEQTELEFLREENRRLRLNASIPSGEMRSAEELQAALQASEARHATLFQAIDEGFCIIEMLFDADEKPLDYRFLEINPAFEEQTGLREATGKRMREMHPAHEAHWFDIYGEVALTGKPVRFIHEARALEDRWFDVYAFRVEDEASRKVAILFRDISERKRSEQMLAERAAEIESLNLRLKQAMTETHHRVKNNLQVISAMIEMQMLEHKNEPTIPIDEFMRLKSHIHTLAIVHDLLTQSVRESEDTQRVSADAVLEKLLPMLQQMAWKQTIHYTLEAVELTSKQCIALSLVLNELVSNALKHGRQEAIVSLVAQRGVAILTVQDDGPGFPEGFDPRVAANTGLDLIDSLVQIDLAGQVRFRNRPEGGGEVSVTFPLPQATHTLGN